MSYSKRKFPLPQVHRVDPNFFSTRCTCGHPRGEHYVKPGWPACSKCTECKAFKAEEEE